LLGIVLAKSLLCGPDVETKDLYDWRTDGFSETIPCSISSFRTLIELCINPHISTDFINVFTTSIIVHFNFNDHMDYNKKEAEQWMIEFYSNLSFNTIQNLGKLLPLDLFTTFNNHWITKQNPIINTPLSLFLSAKKQEDNDIKLYQIVLDLIHYKKSTDIICSSIFSLVIKPMESVQVFLRDFGGRLNEMQHIIKVLELLKIYNDEILKALYHKVVHWNERCSSICQWAVAAASCLLSFGFTNAKIEEVIGLAIDHKDPNVRAEGIRGSSILISPMIELSALPITCEWEDCSHSGADMCPWLDIENITFNGTVDSKVCKCLLQGFCSFVVTGKTYSCQWYFRIGNINSNCYCLMCYNNCLMQPGDHGKRGNLIIGQCFCDCPSDTCLYRNTTL
jgi:hypothetical protein